MEHEDTFITYEDWHEYLYDSLIEKGFAIDEELLETFIRCSIDFLYNQDVIMGSFTIGYDD